MTSCTSVVERGNQYFPGTIEDFNEETNKYKFIYEDRDVDYDMEFFNYQIIMRDDEIDYIRIDANNLDESDEEEEQEE